MELTRVEYADVLVALTSWYTDVSRADRWNTRPALSHDIQVFLVG